jgi:glucose-1-phosphate thymidylyltransferase
VLLCAGEGSRLRPLTFSRPKHLLPVAGKPLLGWALESLAAVGVEQVAVVVGHRPEAIHRYVGDGSAWELSVCYRTQDKPLGLGHAVKAAADFIDGEEFLLYLGDNLLECGLADLVSAFREEPAAATLYVKEVEDPRAYGVAVTEGDRVVALEEKPAEPRSNLAVVGAYAFSPAILDAIAHTPPSARGEYEITDAIQALVNRGDLVRACVVQGFWEDAGRPAELLKANRLYLDRLEGQVLGTCDEQTTLEGVVRVGRGTRLTNCHLHGPCLIAENCVLVDSEIGPYASIDSGCEITDSRVENCIIQQDSRLSHMRGGLSDSVLGQQVEVSGPSEGSFAPMRLLLGDMSAMRAV